MGTDFSYNTSGRAGLDSQENVHVRTDVNARIRSIFGVKGLLDQNIQEHLEDRRTYESLVETLLKYNYTCNALIDDAVKERGMQQDEADIYLRMIEDGLARVYERLNISPETYFSSSLDVITDIFEKEERRLIVSGETADLKLVEETSGYLELVYREIMNLGGSGKKEELMEKYERTEDVVDGLCISGECLENQRTIYGEVETEVAMVLRVLGVMEGEFPNGGGYPDEGIHFLLSGVGLVRARQKTILEIAEKVRNPIIRDEIYGRFDEVENRLADIEKSIWN